jgi:N-acetylmuramoyl-L-alanine amidase
MNTLAGQDPVVILARTMYGEARGEYARLDGGLAALLAVGNVVTNRVQACSWFGRDVVSVCLKPAQFSCWVPSDPNHAAMRKAGPRDKVFQLCMELARHVCQGDYPDLVKGSTHDHAEGIRPGWAQGALPVVRIGRHVFYRVP